MTTEMIVTENMVGNFDLGQLFEKSKNAIETFAEEHKNETFYAFCICSGLLCMCSEKEWEEFFQIEVKKEDNLLFLDRPWGIEGSCYNPGNWNHQGFFNLSDCGGFDDEAFNQHYEIWFDENLSTEEKIAAQKKTSYHIAMRKLLGMLLVDGIFDRINCTEDFKVYQVEAD